MDFNINRTNLWTSEAIYLSTHFHFKKHKIFWYISTHHLSQNMQSENCIFIFKDLKNCREHSISDSLEYSILKISNILVEITMQSGKCTIRFWVLQLTSYLWPGMTSHWPCDWIMLCDWTMFPLTMWLDNLATHHVTCIIDIGHVWSLDKTYAGHTLRGISS